MKKMRVAATVMVTGLTVMMAKPAIAAPADNLPTGDQHTTIGIMQMGDKKENVSFEVPLYITMAAKSNKDEMTMPTSGYDIINTSQAASGGTAYKIGVTSMNIEALGDWSIVDTQGDIGTDPSISLTKMTMSIGDCSMPAVKAGDGKKAVTLGGAFVESNGNPKGIEPNQSLSGTAEGLALKGNIAALPRNDQKAAAQFKITYTVAALDGQGAALGAVYVGDDKTAAGLN